MLKKYLFVFTQLFLKTRINVEYPFILYLLFKYPYSSTGISNTCIFPFTKKQQGKSYKTSADSLVKKLLGTSLVTKGFIEMDDNIYFFYDYTIKNKKITHISNKKESEQLWWTTIDEICNHKN